MPSRVLTLLAVSLTGAWLGCSPTAAPPPVPAPSPPPPAAPPADGSAADFEHGRDWHTFTWSQAAFSVDLPVNATPWEGALDLPSGKMQVYRAVGVMTDVGTFICQSAELPQGSPELTLADRFAHARRADLIETGGVVRGEQSITLGTHPGHQYDIVLPDGGLVRQRMYVALPRLFQLRVVTRPERLDDPHIQRFFDTFQLLGPAVPSPGDAPAEAPPEQSPPP